MDSFFFLRIRLNRLKAVFFLTRTWGHKQSRRAKNQVKSLGFEGEDAQPCKVTRDTIYQIHHLKPLSFSEKTRIALEIPFAHRTDSSASSSSHPHTPAEQTILAL